jgi:hypothetical protein
MRCAAVRCCALWYGAVRFCTLRSLLSLLFQVALFCVMLVKDCRDPAARALHHCPLVHALIRGVAEFLAGAPPGTCAAPGGSSHDHSHSHTTDHSHAHGTSCMFSLFMLVYLYVGAITSHALLCVARRMWPEESTRPAPFARCVGGFSGDPSGSPFALENAQLETWAHGTLDTLQLVAAAAVVLGAVRIQWTSACGHGAQHARARGLVALFKTAWA